eukprot:7748367-Pyramimonas_sp.AAC.1
MSLAQVPHAQALRSQDSHASSSLLKVPRSFEARRSCVRRRAGSFRVTATTPDATTPAQVSSSSPPPLDNVTRASLRMYK